MGGGVHRRAAPADLDGRDGLAEVMAFLPAVVRAERASVLLAWDARFTAATAQDVTGSLDPWLRGGGGRAPQSPVRWWREPKPAPW